MLTTLRAILSSLQDAERRLAELERSEADIKPPPRGTRKGEGATSLSKAVRASRAIARATGVPASVAPSPDIDDLSKLHRDKEIAERLARLKSEL